MRVVVVDPSLFSLPYDDHLCRGISENGHEVLLFGRQLRRGERLGEGSGYGFRPFFFRRSERLLRLPGVGRLLKAAEYVLDSVRFLREVRRLRPDAIHYEWLPLPVVDRWTIARLRRMGLRVVFTVHDTTPLNDAPSSHGQTIGWRELLDRFDALVVHTAGSKEALRKLRVRSEPHVIPHGVLFFGPAPERAANKSVLFFGGIKPYKGLEVLLRAFAASKLAAKLKVVGTCRDIAPYRALIETLSLSRQVELDLRFFDDAELPEIFAQAAVVVFPYHRIDGSGAFLSAIAYAKPFIASAVGMFRELGGEDCPALVPPADVDALARKLDEVLANPEKFRAISENIRAAIPSWREIGARTVELYGSLNRDECERKALAVTEQS